MSAFSTRSALPELNRKSHFTMPMKPNRKEPSPSMLNENHHNSYNFNTSRQNYNNMNTHISSVDSVTSLPSVSSQGEIKYFKNKLVVSDGTAWNTVLTSSNIHDILLKTSSNEEGNGGNIIIGSGNGLIDKGTISFQLDNNTLVEMKNDNEIHITDTVIYLDNVIMKSCSKVLFDTNLSTDTLFYTNTFSTVLDTPLHIVKTFEKAVLILQFDKQTDDSILIDTIHDTKNKTDDMNEKNELVDTTNKTDDMNEKNELVDTTNKIDDMNEKNELVDTTNKIDDTNEKNELVDTTNTIDNEEDELLQTIHKIDDGINLIDNTNKKYSTFTICLENGQIDEHSIIYAYTVNKESTDIIHTTVLEQDKEKCVLRLSSNTILTKCNVYINVL